MDLAAAAALVMLTTGAGRAQIGEITGPANSVLACFEIGAALPELRPESYSELLGDIVITCTGGPPSAVGSPVPTANLVLYLAPSVPVTSRYLSPDGASEVMLIIDEPGSGIMTAAKGGYGPEAPQTVCTSAQQQSRTHPCRPVVGLDSSGQYNVAVLPGTSTPAPNIFQGKIGDFGQNSVVFYDVPVLPPAYQGVSRLFRITNLRAPMAGGYVNGLVQALLSTSPNQTLPLLSIIQNVGVIGPPMKASIDASPAGGGNPFSACTPQVSPALAARITFTEGFATAFKTRVVPGGTANALMNPPPASNPNYAYAAEAQNLAAPFNQNLPGGLYGGIAANSESGFIVSADNGAVAGTTYTAGLMDSGTRLKAVFANIPAGVTLYVSTTNTPNYAVPGGTNSAPYAVLMADNQVNETLNDGANFTPLATATVGNDGLKAYALTPDFSGKAVAIWEVLNGDSSIKDQFTFSVYVAYSSTPGTSSPTSVVLSLSPEPSGGAFSVTSGTLGLVTPAPRFAAISSQGGPWGTINACTLRVSSTACSVGTGTQNAADVQLVVNQVLGNAQPNYDLNGDGAVDVTDIEIAMNVVLSRLCAH